MTASVVFCSGALGATWNGGGGNANWSTGANWGGTAPTSSTTTDLIFAGTTNLGSAGVPLNQNIATPFVLNSLTFNAGGGAFFLGGNALSFDGSAAGANTITQSSSSAINIANDIGSPNSKPTTLTLTGNGTGIVTLAGIISAGSGGRDYTIVKSGTGTYCLTGANTFGGGVTINGGILNAGSSGALGSAGTISFGGGTLQYSAANTTDYSARFSTAASQAYKIDTNGQSVTLATALTSSGGSLDKSGSGTLTLSSASTSTFTGGTTVNAGTLKISAGEKLANTGALTISGGTFDVQTFTETVGTVTLTSGSITGTSTGTLVGSSYGLQSGSVSAIIGGTGALTKSTSGTVTLTGANTYSGGTSISGGILALGSSGALGTSGTISFNGGTLQFSSSNTTDYSGRFSNLANQAYSVDTNGQNVTLATALSSSGGTLTKTGAGTLTVSGGNSYTGATTVSGGTLQVNVNNALGAAAAGTTVSSGAALKLNGVNYSTTEALTLNGTGVSNGGALCNSGTSTFAGAINIATNSTINAGGGTLTLTGGVAKNGTILTIAGGGTVNINTNGITGSSANSDLVVDGTTVVLNTANTYNGPTTIQNSGTLKLGASNVLPTSPQTDMTVNTSSAFDLAGNSDSVASLSGDSTGMVKNSTVSSTSTLTVNPSSGSTTFAGVIAGTNGGTQGNMALVKTGAGTLTLSGINTFSGTTTVSGGVLIVAGGVPGALGSTSSITVNSGGTLCLGASDQINNSAGLTLAGGTFQKGNFSEGTTSGQGIGALTLSASGSHVDFGTGTVGILTFASLTTNTFTLTIDNWTGNFNQVGSASTDRLIFDSDQSSNLGNFVFTGFGTGGAQFALGGGYFEVVAAVPETSTWVSGFLAFSAIVFLHVRARRRFSRRSACVPRRSD